MGDGQTPLPPMHGDMDVPAWQAAVPPNCLPLSYITGPQALTGARQRATLLGPFCFLRGPSWGLVGRADLAAMVKPRL